MSTLCLPLFLASAMVLSSCGRIRYEHVASTEEDAAPDATQDAGVRVDAAFDANAPLDAAFDGGVQDAEAPSDVAVPGDAVPDTLSLDADTGPCAPITHVAASDDSTCAVTTSGRLFCWGSNAEGEVGQGDTLDRSAPTEVALDALFSRVHGGRRHFFAVDAGGGTLYGWGRNASGELGLGHTNPVLVPEALPGAPFAMMDGGGRFTSALDPDGLLYGFGSGGEGRNGLTASTSTPMLVPGVPTASVTGAGWTHGCAVTAAGALFCWGTNADGQLGLGSTTPTGTGEAPIQVGMDMDWVHVTAGDRFTCALRTGDTLWCAGDNTRFQLGSARTADATCLPGGGCTTFAEVPGVTFRDAQAGADHVCGIRTDGALLCWGDNGDNETGTGSAAGSIDVPTPVGIEMDWLMVAPGGGHSCGLRAGGLLFCWGDNVLGQVGQGTAVPNYATPIQVCIPR